MTYNSKKSIASILSCIILIIAYIIYAFSENAPVSEDLKSWAIVMLVFIGIGIAMQIIIQILFHIGLAIGISVVEREQGCDDVERIISSSMVEDERDKLISLKSSHAGYACVGIGFVIALIALAFGVASITAFHIILAAVAGSSIVEGILNIYFNEKGVHNG